MLQIYKNIRKCKPSNALKVSEFKKIQLKYPKISANKWKWVHVYLVLQSFTTLCKCLVTFWKVSRDTKVLKGESLLAVWKNNNKKISTQKNEYWIVLHTFLCQNATKRQTSGKFFVILLCFVEKTWYYDSVVGFWKSRAFWISHYFYEIYENEMNFNWNYWPSIWSNYQIT